MSWKRYEKYLDSGVEWLGEIPEGWKIIPLNRILSDFFDSRGKTPKKLGFEWSENGIPAISANNVQFGKIDITDTNYGSPELYRKWMSSCEVRKGDVIMTSEAPLGVVSQIPDDHKYILSQRVVLLRGDSKVVSNSYLMFFIGSTNFQHFLTTESTGSTAVGIKMSKFKLSNILIPSLPEQSSIATFLDHETARIDALIEKKERLIALLKEKQAALISHAVTKGLDPDAKMKDSGVEWIGMVPERWRVMRIAMAVQKITNGFVGPTRDILVDDGIRYLQSLHIKNGKILFNKPYYVSELWSLGHPKSILKDGDVLIVQTGDVGQCCTVTKEFENCNCHALIILRLKDGYGSGYYLSSLLRSDYGKNILNSIQEGALHPHLECGKVREVPVLLPPLKEQEKILEYLEKKISIIDDMLTRITKSIDTLQEYRSALISAAVTGKIDVRQEVNA